MQLTDALRKDYEQKFAALKILPSKQSRLSAAVAVIVKNRARYEAIEKEVGVPWWMVGVIHMRESSCDFKTYLGNGEPLSRVTRLVPAGRGPFASWEAGAVDALELQGFHNVKRWDLATCLFQLEAYNGWGYHNKGAPSPYLWSFSNQYAAGKYVADGKYSPSTVDPQPGAASMLWQMILLQIVPNIAAKAINMATEVIAPSSPAVAAAKNTSAGVTINKSQNLATHVITAVGAVLAATGLSQVHGIYDAVTNSSLIGGLIVTALAMLISHFNVNGSNDNTLDALDKLLVALTPSHPAQPLTSDPANPPTAAS